MNLTLVSIDFQMRSHFSPVQKAIFYLVGQGYRTLEEIADVLYVFSEEVIAGALEVLVNSQLLTVNLLSGEIQFTPAVNKLIALCNGDAKVQLMYPEEYLDSDGFCHVGSRNIISALLSEIDDGPQFKELTNSIQLLLHKDTPKELSLVE